MTELEELNYESYAKYKDMLLFKIVVSKNGRTYEDYYLAWLHNGRVYDTRITPTFKISYQCLFHRCINVKSVIEIKTIAKKLLDLTR